MGAKSLKGQNCVKTQGSSSDTIVAAICSILPTWSLLEGGCFSFKFRSQRQEHTCPTDPSHPSLSDSSATRLVWPACEVRHHLRRMAVWGSFRIFRRSSISGPCQCTEVSSGMSVPSRTLKMWKTLAFMGKNRKCGNSAFSLFFLLPNSIFESFRIST